jgi:hypothetical protein
LLDSRPLFLSLFLALSIPPGRSRRVRKNIAHQLSGLHSLQFQQREVRVMTNWNSWLLWPDNVALSVLVLGVLAMTFLYAARKPMHGIIHSACTLLSHSMRFVSRWLFLAADNMRLRNQSVLLAHGEESEAVIIEREFERVGDIVRTSTVNAASSRRLPRNG